VARQTDTRAQDQSSGCVAATVDSAAIRPTIALQAARRRMGLVLFKLAIRLLSRDTAAQPLETRLAPAASLDRAVAPAGFVARLPIIAPPEIVIRCLGLATVPARVRCRCPVPPALCRCPAVW
jgi:hypothetical protein